MAKAVVESKIRVNADTRKAQSNLKKLSGSIGGVAKAALAVGVAALGVSKLTGFIKESLTAAMATERAYKIMEARVVNAGYAWGQAEAGVRAFTDSMQTMTGVADEEFAKAMGEFIDLGLDMKTSMAAVRTAMDLSIAKGEDFQAVNKFLAESFANSILALQKWGVVIDQTLPIQQQINTALKELNNQVGGQAQANMDNMATKLGTVTEKWGDFKEQIGMLVAGPLAGLLDAMIGVLTVINTLPLRIEKLGVAIQFVNAVLDRTGVGMAIWQAEMATINVLIEVQNKKLIEQLENLKRVNSYYGPMMVQQEEANEKKKEQLQDIVALEMQAYEHDLPRAREFYFDNVKATNAEIALDDLKRLQYALSWRDKYMTIMAQHAQRFAAGEISLAQMVAKNQLTLVAEMVAHELESRAKLWAARALAAAADFNFFSAAKFAAAAGMAMGGAAVVRSAAASAFQDTTSQMQEDAEAIGNATGLQRQGRTVIAQGPITLNYHSSIVMNGPVIGIDNLYELFNEWNRDNLRAAGYDAQQRARG